MSRNRCAELGLGGVERRDDIEPDMDAVGEPGGVGAAVDRQLGRVERFGRDQREALRPGEARRPQIGERHDPVDHAELARGLGIDRVAEIEELAGLLVADDRRHHDRRADARKADFRLAEHRVVGRDRQVAQHDELAPAAHHMALDRGDHRLFQVPRHHLEIELVGEMLVRLDRVAAPIVGGASAGLAPMS